MAKRGADPAFFRLEFDNNSLKHRALNNFLRVKH